MLNFFETQSTKISLDNRHIKEPSVNMTKIIKNREVKFIP